MTHYNISRIQLQAELDQLAEKLSKPEYAEEAGPE